MGRPVEMAHNDLPATEAVQVERAQTGVHCLSLRHGEELCDIVQRLVKYPSLDNCH